MSDTNNHGSSQRTINHHQRSVSVGDDPHQLPDDDLLEARGDDQNKDYSQYITQCNDQDYICTPLPRSNHQPTATTCWLVYLFTSL
jgi:hypothetical protein